MELINFENRSNLLKKVWNLYEKLAIFHKCLYCLSYVQCYLRPCCTGQLINLFIEVTLTHVPIHLRIVVQGDGVACLIDMCRVKDPDCAFIPQFLTIHGLHPTYKDRTKKMY
jgi:hypothetical protein